jgi:hypothetical protein
MTHAQPSAQNPFRSFWWGGYECTDQLNFAGDRVDFLHLTGHYDRLTDDYRDLLPFGIRTVREGLRWSQIEKTPYKYDFSVLDTMLDRGAAVGIQQVWDICHFGFPDDLSPLHPHFARRFVALCRAFVQRFRDRFPDETLIVTPINEVSFLAWLGGNIAGTVPYCTKEGTRVKYGLMRAYIEGVAAMRELDPTVRILTTEPLVNMVPPRNATPRQVAEAKKSHDEQFQAVDMLGGRSHPELGGKPEFLDILGFNFYYHNQWVNDRSGEFLKWANDDCDPRWRSLSDLLLAAYARYQRPIVLTETSHFGEHRPQWIEFVARECAAVLRRNVPLWGVCLYPIIDRPDWDHLDWHQAGLWNALPEPAPGQPVPRVLHEPYAAGLRRAQQLVASAQTAPALMA